MAALRYIFHDRALDLQTLPTFAPMISGRTIIGAFLVLALMVQTFYQPSLLLSYYMNTAAYERACVNKARPMLHCNGQCLLAKKMREAEKQEKDTPERKLGSEVLYHTSAFASLPAAPVYLIKKIYRSDITSSPTDYHHSIFHPPSIS